MMFLIESVLTARVGKKNPGYNKRKPAQWVYWFFWGLLGFFNLNVIRIY